MTDGEALQAILSMVRQTANHVADIHARVIVHDGKVRELESRVGVLETKRISTLPPGRPPPSKLSEWYSEKSRVFRVPQDDMDHMMAEIERRDRAGKWDAAVRFASRVLAPVLATALTAILAYVLWHK